MFWSWSHVILIKGNIPHVLKFSNSIGCEILELGGMKFEKNFTSYSHN
jgi:hypothetical protein